MVSRQLSLAVSLAAKSANKSPRRVVSQILTSGVVTFVLIASVLTTNNGTAGLATAVRESGADIYSVRAVDSSGEPEPITEQTMKVLNAASGLERFTATATVDASIVGSHGIKPTSTISVLAINRDSLAFEESIVLSKPIKSTNQQTAVVGDSASHLLGLTQACVRTGTCGLTINGNRYQVAAIRDFNDTTYDASVLIDLEETMLTGQLRGPLLLEIASSSLPVNKTARLMDSVLGLGGQRIFVEPPTVAGGLREGFSKTWQRVAAASAITLMAITAFSQVTLQLASIRARSSEVATLRSLGMTPGTVLIQFMAEPLLTGLLGSILGIAGTRLAMRIAAATGNAAQFPTTDAIILTALFVLATLAASLVGAVRTATISPSEVFLE